MVTVNLFKNFAAGKSMNVSTIKRDISALLFFFFELRKSHRSKLCVKVFELELLDHMRRHGYVNMIINIYCWIARVWDDDGS